MHQTGRTIRQWPSLSFSNASAGRISGALTGLPSLLKNAEADFVNKATAAIARKLKTTDTTPLSFRPGVVELFELTLHFTGPKDASSG